MRRGSRADQVDFGKFQAYHFTPHLSNEEGESYSFFSSNGCGASALAVLTGENPKSMKSRPDWDKQFMARHLRKRGFKVKELTRFGVTNRQFAEYPIDGKHVILACCKFNETEASWVVVHRNKLYHNFEKSKLRPYEFLNHPIISAFIVMHPKWAKRRNVYNRIILYNV